MAKNLNEIMQNLPRDSEALLRSADRVEKIEARAAELIAEYMTLQDVRKARELTQERMAELLGIRQDSVSKLEKRTDLVVCT
jgi:DNA-binding XRE family transcriptional regulator